MGCHALFQGIFPSQGLNQISYVSCIADRLGFPHNSVSKASACNVGDLGFNLWVGKFPWSRKMAAHSSILA